MQDADTFLFVNRLDPASFPARGVRAGPPREIPVRIWWTIPSAARRSPSAAGPRRQRSGRLPLLTGGLTTTYRHAVIHHAAAPGAPASASVQDADGTAGPLCEPVPAPGAGTVASAAVRPVALPKTERDNFSPPAHGGENGPRGRALTEPRRASALAVLPRLLRVRADSRRRPPSSAITAYLTSRAFREVPAKTPGVPARCAPMLSRASCERSDQPGSSWCSPYDPPHRTMCRSSPP
jgi:hypothetical protein